jgi:hypothetical protein
MVHEFSPLACVAVTLSKKESDQWSEMFICNLFRRINTLKLVVTSNFHIRLFIACNYQAIRSQGP